MYIRISVRVCVCVRVCECVCVCVRVDASVLVAGLLGRHRMSKFLSFVLMGLSSFPCHV